MVTLPQVNSGSDVRFLMKVKSVLQTNNITQAEIHHQRSEVDRTYAKVTWRLIPLLFMCYVAAYLDRFSVGFARLQILADQRFSEIIYRLGLGIFFIGDFLLEVPSNIIWRKVSATTWIPRIIIA